MPVTMVNAVIQILVSHRLLNIHLIYQHRGSLDSIDCGRQIVAFGNTGHARELSALDQIGWRHYCSSEYSCNIWAKDSALLAHFVLLVGG